MRIGGLSLHIGPSAWQDHRWHFLDGRLWPPVMTRMSEAGPVMGRGVVLAAAGWMLWVMVDEYVFIHPWLEQASRESAEDRWAESELKL